MARYIDADAVLNRLPDDLPYKASVKRVLIQAPTADVVPKSELDDLQSLLDAAIAGQETLQEALAEAKTEVVREIFEEIESNYAEFLFDGCRNIIVLTERGFAELKKKYAEQCPKCKHFVGCDPYKTMFYKTSGESCEEFEEAEIQ